MPQNSVCHGETGGRQTGLPQELLQVQRVQQDTWVRREGGKERWRDVWKERWSRDGVREEGNE